MPFGLKFKRTRRYEISTKNIFVVGVEMPDHSYLECTLNSDSTGQECLDSIAQRIELAQTQYFGLRYVTKKLQYHWVDLSKPLKKQLDKNVQSLPSPRLYFGVMFYIQGAHKIGDDVARYQYFLQLKNDIVEGRIPMSVKQVLRLASFSLQAEFGDYEFDKPAQDYFEDNQLFPKTMCRDENTVTEMMNEAINGYASLQGIHPVKAEVQYIKEVQLMDGYGMEYYTAKDDKGKELYLGTSYSGILARYLDGSPTICFRWTEIARITQSKKVLEVDTSKSSYQYALEDTDTAKYLKRMGYLLQKFYKSNKGTPRETNQVTHQQVFSDHLTHSQTSLTYSQHSQQSHDQRYDQDLSQSSVEDFYRQSQQSLETSSGLDVPHQQTDNYPAVSNGMFNTTLQQPDLQVDQQYQNKHVVLPAYRPSPSYDDVMRQRMPHQHQPPPPPQRAPHQPGIVQDAHIYQQQGDNVVYTPREMAPDVTYTQDAPYMNSESVQIYDNKTMYANVFQDEKNHYLQLQPNERTSNLILQPTYSSPELTTQVFPQQYSSDNMLHENLQYHYKPPPPYPLHSSSTPDLAAQTIRSNSSDSPDLVSRKNLGLSASGLQSNLDKSLENLSEAVPVPREELPNVQGQITQNVIEMPQISVSQVETDDGSSDHSGATFHVRDTDSEMEESSDRTPKRENSKTEIAIKFVAPNKAPPPSTSKEVITRRESFRRQMIARAGQFNPNSSTTEDSVSLVSKAEENVIPEHVDSSSNENVNINQSELRKINTSDYDQPPLTRRFSSRRISRRSNTSVKETEKVVVRDVTEVKEKPFDLQVVPPPGSDIKYDLKELVSSHGDDKNYDSSSDSDFEKDATIKLKMGPLKMAAMNGLTLSRPMVLALMNDESRAPKDERRRILENKLSENLVFKEFEEIPKKVLTMECSVSKLPENESRNRFKDVLPYDATRVKLTPRKDNHNGYINASHVKLSVGDRVWWYIATQAPMKDSTVDFWQMVWEQEVDVIAMLTDLTELGKQKCFPYWPQEVGVEHKILFGQYEVTLLFCNDSLCYITNRISVVHLPSKKERQVWHLQYTDWPDHGCPEDMYGFLGFLDEVESVQRLAESEEGSGKKSPILVHCSAGVGRTGVVILTQVMKWCLEHNHDIDLPKALGAIRNQRMFMVQTLGQYNFIHKTLIQYLKNTRLI